MFPASFDYVRPTSIADAIRFLNDHPEDAKVLAGGQSLIPLLKLRLVFPQYLVDIGRLHELRRIEERAGMLEIGALVRHSDIEGSELIARLCPLLAETAAEIGDVQVRHRGTIGGSLAHADPSADFTAAALALDAGIAATGPDGERTISAEEFFTDLMTTSLRSNEILTSVQIPVAGLRTGSAYVKMHQQASGFAIVGVASVVTRDPAGKITDARIGVTGVGAVPYRARAVEQALRGKMPSEREIAEACALATHGVDPLSDIHASANYRHEMAAVYTRRSIDKAVLRAGGRA